MEKALNLLNVLLRKKTLVCIRFREHTGGLNRGRGTIVLDFRRVTNRLHIVLNHLDFKVFDS
jgi:hypothetical protein